MAAPATSEALVLLMRQRHSARGQTQRHVPAEFVRELNEIVLPTAPSGGNFRRMFYALDTTLRPREPDSLLVCSSDISAVRDKYGVFWPTLLNQEAGFLAAMAIYYGLTKGIQLRYNLDNTPDKFPYGVYCRLTAFDLAPRNSGMAR